MFPNPPVASAVYWVVPVSAFALSVCISGLLARFAAPERIKNPARRAPLNSAGKPVATFGGLGVILSFLAALWIAHFMTPPESRLFDLFLILTLGASAMLILGVLDDLFEFFAKTKFIFQALIVLGLYFSGFGVPQVGSLELWKPLSFLLAILWMAGMANAVNLIDGYDGLAGGIILISCLAMFLVYLGRDLHLAALLAIALSGSLLGFFIFNFPPAKIILGDTGSLPIGLLASLIALFPVNQGFVDEIYFLIPVVLLLYPMLDAFHSFARRILAGKNPFQKDELHFHHRLARLGFSSKQIIFLLYGISIYFCLLSLVPIYDVNLIPNFIPIFLVFIIINVALFLFLLSRYEKKVGS